jgi:uncharacterized RDD family membrane protein YckC
MTREMVNCDECGAPLEGAGEPCGSCGAERAPATTNGTSHPRFEEPNGLVREDAPRVHGEAQSPLRPHDDETPLIRRTPDEDAASRVLRFANVVTPREPRPASFASRAIALFLDLVLLSVLDAVLVMLATTAVLLAERVTGERVGGAVDLIRSAVSAGSLTLLIGYFSVLHARSGQTLGKAAMRIRVCDEDGGRVAIPASVLRTFSYALSALPLGAGFLLALLPAQRALHDRIASTRVVRVEGNE